jgi:hypothetical protein
MSVDNLALFGLHWIEVRNIEIADSIERRDERLVDLLASPRLAQLGAQLPQRPEHARPVKPLPFTVFAKAHLDITLPQVP